MTNSGLWQFFTDIGGNYHWVVLGNILLALVLGLMVGYERYYRGRAAGMRTYGFVCMAACALTTICGYEGQWFGAQNTFTAIDPSRTIQGIITGIGFLGAGVIMRDGMNISGLTTAASIWSLAAVGVLVGVGFYDAAILIAVVLMLFMMWRSKIEFILPARHALFVVMEFRESFVPHEEHVREIFQKMGYDIASGSFSIVVKGDTHEWRFVAISRGRRAGASLVHLSQAVSMADGVESCNISHARN